MQKSITQFIAGAVTLVIIYSLVNSLGSRETDPGRQEGLAHYVVRMPRALKQVYFYVFVFGMVLFVVFLTAMLTVGGGVTDAHLVFALVIAGIGLLVAAVADKWHICVDGGQATVYRLFHRTQTVLTSGLDEAVVGKKDQIILYKGGKKVVTVDALADNYEAFRKDLGDAGKLVMPGGNFR